MKYFNLVWSALFRKKTRTFLTLVSILAAFVLFGMLNGVRVAFGEAGHSAQGALRLQTSSKLSFMQLLPVSLEQQIAKVPGVSDVGYASWFGGAYQKPEQQVVVLAVSPNFMDLYPEQDVTPAAAKAFADTRTGALIGEQLAKRFHWKVGDQVPLLSTIYPQKNGSKSWPVNIVGILHPKPGTQPGLPDVSVLMHWKYFEEGAAFGTDGVGWYIERVANVNESDRVAKAIDALSANSDHETKTMTEQAAVASAIKQVADIGLIVGAIMGAVFFTLILLTGNTMAQAVRERTAELAVLKTIGFSRGSVLGMVLAESILLVLIGGVLGLAIVMGVSPIIGAVSGGTVGLPPVGASTWALGIGLMILIGLLVGAIPAARAMRLNIVDALAGR